MKIRLLGEEYPISDAAAQKINNAIMNAVAHQREHIKINNKLINIFEIDFIKEDYTVEQLRMDLKNKGIL